MFYAAKAGMKEAEKYSVRPDAASGNFMRKLRHTLPAYAADKHHQLCRCEGPSYCRSALGRSSHKFSLMPAHEQIAEGVAALHDPRAPEPAS